MREKKATLKRVVLSFLMCMALAILGLPLGEVHAEPTPVPYTNATVIDTSKTGSITIHKYEYENSDGMVGTGSDTDTVPAGAKALAGVGFTVYKVNDVTVETYYNGITSSAALKVSDYITGDKKADLSKVTIEGTEVVTGADGIAYFGNLPLGVYLVVETTTPAKVTTAADPFLVSIPMTTSSETDWLYDVHVFPKNKTTYGGVTLNKTGVTTNGASQALEGVTFILQKEVTAGTWENITTSEQDGSDLTLVTDASGNINISGLSPGNYRFVESSVGNNYGYIMDGKTAYNFTVNADTTVTYNGVPAANVIIPAVNYKPGVEKKIAQKTALGTTKIDANYSVGDKIAYTVMVYVPNNITELKKFTLSDEPTNIKVDTDTITISYEAGGAQTLIKDMNYTVTPTTNGFTVDFAESTLAACAGKTLTIAYKATLLNTAVTDKTGNKNTMSLVYSSNIAPETAYENITKPDETIDTTIKDEAVVYTFNLELIKKDEAGTPLAGAQFDLYGEYIAGVSNGTALETSAAEALKLPNGKQWVKIGTTQTTDSNGKITYNRLSNGTYYLVETQAPDGYNLLAAPVEVNVNYTYSTATTISAANATTIYVKAIDSAGSTLTVTSDSDSNNIQDISIVNRKGFVLPTTGGAGGFLFTLIGCTVMIVGFILFRKTKEKNTDAC